MTSPYPAAGDQVLYIKPNSSAPPTFARVVAMHDDTGIAGDYYLSLVLEGDDAREIQTTPSRVQRLMPGWGRFLDTNSNCYFFHNSDLDQTLWDTEENREQILMPKISSPSIIPTLQPPPPPPPLIPTHPAPANFSNPERLRELRHSGRFLTPDDTGASVHHRDLGNGSHNFLDNTEVVSHTNGDLLPPPTRLPPPPMTTTMTNATYDSVPQNIVAPMSPTLADPDVSLRFSSSSAILESTQLKLALTDGSPQDLRRKASFLGCDAELDDITQVLNSIVIRLSEIAASTIPRNEFLQLLDDVLGPNYVVLAETLAMGGGGNTTLPDPAMSSSLPRRPLVPSPAAQLRAAARTASPRRVAFGEIEEWHPPTRSPPGSPTQRMSIPLTLQDGVHGGALKDWVNPTSRIGYSTPSAAGIATSGVIVERSSLSSMSEEKRASPELSSRNVSGEEGHNDEDSPLRATENLVELSKKLDEMLIGLVGAADRIDSQFGVVTTRPEPAVGNETSNTSKSQSRQSRRHQGPNVAAVTPQTNCGTNCVIQ